MYISCVIGTQLDTGMHVDQHKFKLYFIDLIFGDFILCLFFLTLCLCFFVSLLNACMIKHKRDFGWRRIFDYINALRNRLIYSHSIRRNLLLLFQEWCRYVLQSLLSSCWLFKCLNQRHSLLVHWQLWRENRSILRLYKFRSLPHFTVIM